MKNSSFKTNGKKTARFFGTPLFNVLLMLALMLAVSAFFKFLEWRRMNAHAQIQIRDSVNFETSRGGKQNASAPSEIFGGEVFDTSIRLRETAAFGFALCISVLDEAGTKRTLPGSINGLLDAAVSRDLLPPGFKIENGKVHTASSKIYVRYQVQPMQLEIVSLSLDARRGPALIMRFPLESTDGKNIAYFQSVSTTNVSLPAPFAPAHEIIKSGWTVEAWRGLELNGKQNFAEMLINEQKQLKERQPANSSAR